MNWNDKPQVKKGNIGEDIVKQYLINNGYIPYKPDAPGAHPFDHLCASRDKRNIFIADTKSKPARIYYPDTGINLKNYKEYKYIQEKHNLNVFIFFVDEDSANIYGNFLKVLDKEISIDHNGVRLDYPRIEKNIIYFPLISMKQIGKIPEKDLSMLRAYSTRNDAYEQKAEA